METWLLADLDAFTRYFGKGFKKEKLPRAKLEDRAKSDVYHAIDQATASAKPKGKYGKARDSFKLLALIDPTKLRNSCAWADRFFNTLDDLC